jgi:hypothetical protein
MDFIGLFEGASLVPAGGTVAGMQRKKISSRLTI